MHERPDLNSEKGNKRLEQEEALALQMYATAKEGIGFSEQAGEAAYEEAEMFLTELRLQFEGKGIEWAAVNWEANLRNPKELEDVSEKLSVAIAAFLEKSPNIEPTTAAKIRSYINKNGGIVLLVTMLAAFASLNSSLNRLNDLNFHKADNPEFSYSIGDTVKIEVGSTGSTDIAPLLLSHWARNHKPEILMLKELTISSIRYSKDTSTTSARIFAIKKDGTVISVEGTYSGSPDEITGNNKSKALNNALDKLSEELSSK